MRIPGEVLDHVRGAMVIAALGSACSSPPPHEAISVAPSEVVVAAPVEPIDPVAYAATDEDARLSRLDAEALVDDDARSARLTQLAADRRAAAVVRHTGGYDFGDIGISAMCGRG